MTTRASALLALLCSCSFMDVRGPSRGARAPIACTDDFLLPALDTGFAIGATALAATIANDTVYGEPKDSDLLFFPLAAVAILEAIAAAYGFTTVVPCRRAKARERVAEQRARSQGNRVNDIRNQAWELTKRAAAAARDGDCSVSVEMDAQVRALDEDFHDTVFVRDAAIARCIAR